MKVLNQSMKSGVWLASVFTFATLISGLRLSWGEQLLSLQPNSSSSDIAALTQERQNADQFKSDLQTAWAAFNIGDTGRAMAIFQQVLDSPDSTDAERVQALFGLGTNCQFALPGPKPEKAREYFQRIIDEYPDNSVSAWALLKLGTLLGTDSFEAREHAREYFRQLLERYPNSLAIHEAVIRMAATYFFELEPDLAAKGTQLLEAHLQKYPDNPLAAIMHFRLVYWYAEVDRDYERSLEHGLVLGKIKMADPDRWAQQYWNVAQILRLEVSQPQEAVKWYQKIIDECPWDALGYEARRRIEMISHSATGDPPTR